MSAEQSTPVLNITGDSAYLRVHATPGAKRQLVGGLHDCALRVSVTAPADQGKANQAIIAALAKSLQIKPRQIELASGSTHRRKIFRIFQPPAELSARVEQLTKTE